MDNELINVLLIEDNPGDVRFIQELLAEESHVSFDVACTNRLSEGLSYLVEDEIDVVLLDLSLPDSHGYSTFTIVQEQSAQVPIIVFTATDDEKLAARAMRDGAQDYLIKGQVDANVLVRSIRYAIERKASQRAYRSLVENSLQGLAILQGQKVVFTNDAISDILGYTVDELKALDPDALREVVYPDDRDLVWGRFQDRLEGKEVPPRYEFRILRKEGTLCWVEMFSSRIEFEDKPAIQATFMDITERKRTESALRESEVQYRTTIDSMGDAIHVVDSDLRILFFNETFKCWNEKLGIRTDVTGRAIHEVFPFLPASVRDEYHQVFSSGKILITDERTTIGHCEYLTETRKIPVFENGRVARVVTVVRDVTERRRAEEALRESEGKYRNLIDNSEDAIYLLYDGKFEIINRRFTELFGYSQEETNASEFNFMELVAPQSKVLIQERADKVLRGESVSPRYEFTALSREGREIEVEISVSYTPYKGGTATQGVLRDISERKRAEEALRERAARLGVIASIGQKTTAIMDLNELLHHSVNLIGETFDYYNVIILLVDGQELVLRAATLPDLQSKEGLVRLRIGSDGITGWVAGSGEPLLIPDVHEEARYIASLEDMKTQSEIAVPIVLKGRVVGVLDAQSSQRGAFTPEDVFTLQTLADQLAVAIENARLYEQASQEIIERKRIEESLRIDRDKLQNILDNMNDQVIIEDGQFTIIYQNRKSIETVGDVVGSKCYEAIRNRKQPCDQQVCSVKEVVRQKRNGPFYYTSEARDGLNWEVVAIPISHENDERVVLEIVRDITERKQLQEQLIQAEKMSAIGQLISGVAHELNNPLTGILGFTQLLLMSDEIPESKRHSLDTIHHEAERARKIVQNLLTFARRRKVTRRKVLIHDIVGQTLDMRAYDLRVSNIEIVRRFDHDCPSILADDHQLQQVFVNLIINAEQAMLEAHGKGRLEVVTTWDREKDIVQIRFQDDGPGIDAEYLSKVFDPFFTTKPVGKGTGLGLSISYGIIQEHGGQIQVVSKKGQGATFIVELPVLDAKTLATESSSKTRPREMVTGRRILVVDDEKSVVDLVKETLLRGGHDIDVAYDGVSALEKLQSKTFDAVISDLKMPGMSGIHIYNYCKENRSDLLRRFLFLTGDVGSENSLCFIEEHKLPYISKPFDINDLVSHLDMLLGEAER